MKLLIQIPCFNEEETLPQTIADLPREIDGISQIEIVVINDGSSDGTSELARSLGVQHILDLPYNQGLAAAFSRGIQYGYEMGADIIVNTDGDNQYCGADIEKLVRPILEGKAQMVIGDRQTSRLGHFSPLKKALQRLGSRVTSMLAGITVPDATSGFRAFSRDLCHNMFLFTKFSYTLETIIMCGQRHIPVVSVPIRTNLPTRPSRLFRSIPQFLGKSVMSIFKIYLLYASSSLLANLGLLSLFLGLIPGVRFLILAVFGSGDGYIQSLIMGTILIVTGVLLLVCSLIVANIQDNRKLLEAIYQELRRNES